MAQEEAAVAGRRRFRASIALLVGLGLGALSAFAPAGGIFAESLDEFNEAAAAAFQAQAAESGALGVFYDDASGEAVVVFSGDGPPSFTPTGAAATVRARLETRDISATQIKAIEDGLLSVATSERLSLGAYFDPQPGKVVIQTESPAAVFESLLSAFPAKTTLLNSPVVRYSRNNDGAPHWGGAKIASPGFAPCSSGFTVANSSGTRYMLTAGHCFPNGAIVTSGGGLAFGTIVQRAEYPTFDMELIGGSTYAGRIYNAEDCCTSAPVAGASDPVVGRAIYCHSGFFSLSGCGETVTDLHALFCTDGDCTPDTMKFDAPDPPGGGDSGGPFYLPGSSVYIRGMVIGGGVFSCPCYGEKWSSISGKSSPFLSIRGLRLVINASTMMYRDRSSEYAPPAHVVRLASLMLAGLAIMAACEGGPSADPTRTPEPAAIPSASAAPDGQGGPTATGDESPSPTTSPSTNSTPVVPTSGAVPPSEACGSSEEHRAFFRQAAASMSWPVYCVVLPDGWFLEAGSYRLADGGRLEVTYRGPDDARLSLVEGNVCAGTEVEVCAPRDMVIGPAAFGDREGELGRLANGLVLDVDRGATPSWRLTGVGLTEEQFRAIAAAVVKVVG